MTVELTLTIPASTFTEDLTGFPVPVVLSASCGTSDFDASAIFTEIADDWGKLQAYDAGDNRLYVEVESWNSATSTAYLHIKSDIDYDADTVITLKASSSYSADSTYIGEAGSAAAQGVWDSSHTAVFTCAQDPTGGAGCIIDSTGNGNDGTPAGSMTSGDLVADDYGRPALSFDGIDDFISLPNIAAGTDETFEAWLKPESVISGDCVITTDGDGLVFAKNAGVGLYTALLIDSDALVRGSSVVTGNWIYIVGTSDGHFYENGVDVTGSIVNAGWALGGVSKICSSYYPRNPAETIGYLARHDTIRSAEWIRAKYLGLTDQLLTVDASSDTTDADVTESLAEVAVFGGISCEVAEPTAEVSATATARIKANAEVNEPSAEVAATTTYNASLSASISEPTSEVAAATTYNSNLLLDTTEPQAQAAALVTGYAVVLTVEPTPHEFEGYITNPYIEEVASYSLTYGRYDEGMVFDHHFTSTPPTGRIVRFYNGRAYIASGRYIFYSEQFSYDLFKLMSNYLVFPDVVDIMEPVKNGIYIAYGNTTKFYAGEPGDGFNVMPVFDYGGIYGTGVTLPETGEVMWQSHQGAVIGSHSGSATNTQRNTMATDTATSGASMYRQQDGEAQFLAALKDPTVSKLAASGFISAEIIRRGE